MKEEYYRTWEIFSGSLSFIDSSEIHGECRFIRLESYKVRVTINFGMIDDSPPLIYILIYFTEFRRVDEPSEGENTSTRAVDFHLRFYAV